MTLDIGPGPNIQPHTVKPVVRIDHRAVAQPTCVGDVRRLPFKDCSFSVVYASHVLEHFHKRETDQILHEWVRVLRPGGELQLFVPNLEWCMLQIQAGICDEFVLNALYGRQEYPSDVHRTGFTPNILLARLANLPLANIDLRTFRNSLCVWAKKYETQEAREPLLSLVRSA